MPPIDRPPNLEALLDGMTFPATKSELIDYAEGNDPTEEAMELLHVLPGEEYGSLEDVNKDLGLTGALPNEENWWPSHRADELYSTKGRDLARIRGKGKISPPF